MTWIKCSDKLPDTERQVVTGEWQADRAWFRIEVARYMREKFWTNDRIRPEYWMDVEEPK